MTEEVDAKEAIEIAMAQVRSKGLSDEHINMLFEGENEISTREALLIAHVQHLEGKVFAYTSVLEEIASLHREPANLIAKLALENLATPREVKEE